MVLFLAGLIGGVQPLATREMYTVCKPGLKFYPKSLQMYVQEHFGLAVSARTGLYCNVLGDISQKITVKSFVQKRIQDNILTQVISVRHISIFFFFVSPFL